METVKFVHMADGTREDYALLDRLEEQFTDGLPGRILEHLEQLDGSISGYKVSRLSIACSLRPGRIGRVNRRN
ncbi:MAG: hypothetical protein Ct9H300mP16_14010 [Pseudomonadota bacterium]|nr:MAG: hypothetical protein Ct9H300mP16_14010 [Pseudomonadota bacterium]